MKIELLKPDRLEDFLNYCRKYRAKVDGTFLHDEDLKNFVPDNENPTYIASNEQGNIVATASLIINDYYKRGKQARFRIFHSEHADPIYYKLLLDEILKHTEGLEKIFLFVELDHLNYKSNIENLGFRVERYSFVLVREEQEVPELSMPAGFELKSFQRGRDEEVWCNIRNEGFAQLKGSQTSITPEMVTEMISGDDYINDGLKILYHLDKPVGIIRGTKEDYEGKPAIDIGPLAVIPEYQGKGLGRILLRALLKFAKDKQYHQSILCVNAENEGANKLYIQEGFKQVESLACYMYDLTWYQ